MPSIGEVLNAKRVLERRGSQRYGVGEYSVFHINSHFVVVAAQKRGTYYVVPNAYADNPRAFDDMITAHEQDPSTKTVRGLRAARRLADDARLRVLEREGR